MFKNLVYILIAIILASCAILSNKQAKIKNSKKKLVKAVWTESAKDLLKCKKLSKVEATPGGRAGGARRESLITDLKNDTKKIGGNVVLSKLELKSGTFYVFSNHIQGVAYNCPGSIYENLTDLASL